VSSRFCVHLYARAVLPDVLRRPAANCVMTLSRSESQQTMTEFRAFIEHHYGAAWACCITPFTGVNARNHEVFTHRHEQDAALV